MPLQFYFWLFFVLAVLSGGGAFYGTGRGWGWSWGVPIVLVLLMLVVLALRVFGGPVSSG